MGLIRIMCPVVLSMYEEVTLIVFVLTTLASVDG